MADFRETLEVSRNITCFLSYSFCVTKEDLATEEDMLPNLPMEIVWECWIDSSFPHYKKETSTTTIINDNNEKINLCAFYIYNSRMY